MSPGYARALPLLRGGSPGRRCSSRRRRWDTTSAQLTSPCFAAVSRLASGLHTGGKSCACFAAHGQLSTRGPGDSPAIPQRHLAIRRRESGRRVCVAHSSRQVQLRLGVHLHGRRACSSVAPTAPPTWDVLREHMQVCMALVTLKRQLCCASWRRAGRGDAHGGILPAQDTRTCPLAALGFPHGLCCSTRSS